jgi:uncharacterized membrane protein YobD (UPF0266 family)
MLFLLLFPPITIFYFILFHGITVPFWDQWELVPLIQKANTGKLTILDIRQQHNEHRIFFQIIILTLASLSKWNIIYDLFTNFLLAALALLFIYLLLRHPIDNHSDNYFFFSRFFYCTVGKLDMGVAASDFSFRFGYCSFCLGC